MGQNIVQLYSPELHTMFLLAVYVPEGPNEQARIEKTARVIATVIANAQRG